MPDTSNHDYSGLFCLLEEFLRTETNPDCGNLPSSISGRPDSSRAISWIVAPAHTIYEKIFPLAGRQDQENIPDSVGTIQQVLEITTIHREGAEVNAFQELRGVIDEVLDLERVAQAINSLIREIMADALERWERKPSEERFTWPKSSSDIRTDADTLQQAQSYYLERYWKALSTIFGITEEHIHPFLTVLDDRFGEKENLKIAIGKITELGIRLELAKTLIQRIGRAFDNSSVMDTAREINTDLFVNMYGVIDHVTNTEILQMLAQHRLR